MCLLLYLLCIFKFQAPSSQYLTIIPLALMASESIAYSAFGLMGYWLRAHSGSGNNFFSKIQLVGQKYRNNFS